MPTHSHCQNCGAALQGPHCHQCGQHDFDMTRSFRHTFLEALESFFHFDEKLFRNVSTLLVRPGRLSHDYNAGKRASQMPPFRLYFFVSILFFVAAYLSGSPPIRQARPVGPEPGVTNGRTQPAGQPDTTGSGGRLDQFFAEKLGNFMEHQEEAADVMAKAFPKILILCLPVFALLTRFLFSSAGQTYLQHLVVALHFHTFIFLWGVVTDGWVAIIRLGSVRLGEIVETGALIWLVLYPLLMFRRLFGESWAKIGVKSVVIFVAYNIALIGSFLTAVAGLFLLG